MWLDPLLTRCLIGRTMDNLELKRDIKHFPFNIVDKGGEHTKRIRCLYCVVGPVIGALSHWSNNGRLRIEA
jgi:hypothetical protein